MIMAPMMFKNDVEKWLDDVENIRERDIPVTQKWHDSIGISRFFLEFSPEFYQLLRKSRDSLGCFEGDVVDLIRGVFGKTAFFSCSTERLIVFLYCHMCNVAIFSTKISTDLVFLNTDRTCRQTSRSSQGREVCTRTVCAKARELQPISDTVLLQFR